jgi:Glycosyl transferase family 2
MTRLAVMTMVRDESAMLPRWLDYYAAQVGMQNLVVIDDNSGDGSTTGLPCTVNRLPPGPWPLKWAKARTRLVNGFARALLACYDVVAYTDVDEFLLPDPDRYDGLLDYLATRTDREVMAPVGVNLLHVPGVEPPLRPDQPVTDQRSYVKFAPNMCKPLLKRVDVAWTPGFHGVRNPYEIDPDLMLLHLKFCDLDLMRRAAEQRHAWHTVEGRGAPASHWTMGPDELESELRSWTKPKRGARDIPEFTPEEAPLSHAVGAHDGQYRARRMAPEPMAKFPLRRLPHRFSGLV